MLAIVKEESIKRPVEKQVQLLTAQPQMPEKKLVVEQPVQQPLKLEEIQPVV